MQSKKLIVLLITLILMVTSVTSAFADVNPDELFPTMPDDLKEFLADDLDISDEIKDGNVVEDPLKDVEEWDKSPIDHKRYEEDVEKAERKYRRSEVTDNMSASKKIDETTEYYSFSIAKDEKLIGISLGSAINGVANIVFGIAKMWIGFCAKITGWALQFEMYNVFQNGIDKMLSSITKSAGNPLQRSDSGATGLIWLGVAFSLCSVVLLFFKRQTAGAFGKLLGTMFIVTLIGSYVILPNNFMDMLQEFSTQIGSSILSNGDNKTPGDGATEAIWIMGVDQPWQEIEFGEIIDPAPKGALASSGTAHEWLIQRPQDRFEDEGQILSDTTGENITPLVDCPGSMNKMEDNEAVQALRVGQAFFILIVDFVLGLLFLLLSAVALGFQIGSIVLWIMGFFVLIVALFPTHGVGKIKEWASTLALTYFGQIVVYVVLLLVTQMMGSLYELGELTKVFGALAGLCVGVYLMKRPIMSLFSGGGALAGAGAGGIMDLGKATRARLGGYRGDSTERLMPSPIRQNREARRQVQKEAKMQKYQARLDNKRDKRTAKADRSVTGAAATYAGAKINEAKAKVTKPVREVADSVNAKREKAAEKIKLAAKDPETMKKVEARQAVAREKAAQKYNQSRNAQASGVRREAYAVQDKVPAQYDTREARQAAIREKTVETSQQASKQKEKMMKKQQRKNKKNAPPKKMNK